MYNKTRKGKYQDHSLYKIDVVTRRRLVGAKTHLHSGLKVFHRSRAGNEHCPWRFMLTRSAIEWYEEQMYSTRIYYQDTDAGGVVYYGNYLRFLEKSWFEYLMSIGISMPEWEESDTYVMVKTVFLDLVEKVQHGDIIQVATSVKEVRNAYFVLSHRIIKEGKVTTKGETKMVCVDGKGKLQRIPALFREKLSDNVTRQ